jgi:glycosyltransferase involved in cell wall biosynthesis
MSTIPVKMHQSVNLHFLCPGDINSLTGSHIFTKRFAEGLKKNGHQITIHQLSNDFPFPSDKSLQTVQTILSLIPESDTIIFDNLISSSISALLKECAHRNHLICLFHLPLSIYPGFSVYQREMLAFSESESLGFIHHILAVGPFVEKFLLQQGIDKKKIILTFPGVEDCPQKKIYQPKPYRLLSVANLIRSKGHVTLVKALSALNNINWILDCYGDLDLDRQYLADLQALIRRNNLQNKIFIHGTISGKALSDAYLSADLFIHPSEFETYGIALTEALAHGIPVIASTGGGTLSTVPASMGKFFKPDDVYGLETILEVVFENTEIYKKLCNEASRYKSQAITWQKSADDFELAMQASNKVPKNQL